MTRYIVDRYGWQEACNGIMCSECQFRDGHGNCKIGLYISSQPVYEEEKTKETDKANDRNRTVTVVFVDGVPVQTPKWMVDIMEKLKESDGK